MIFNLLIFKLNIVQNYSNKYYKVQILRSRNQSKNIWLTKSKLSEKSNLNKIDYKNIIHQY